MLPFLWWPKSVPVNTVDDLLVGFKYIGATIDRMPDDMVFLFGTEESHGYLADARIRDKEAATGVLLAECAAATELLQARSGASGVVLFGLCSGADDAHRVALANDAVVGMAQIDGHGAITAGFKWRYVAHRLASPRRWQNWFERKFGAPADADRAVLEGVDFFQMPERDTLAHDLALLAKRDVRLFYAYSGATHSYYNHSGQLRRALAQAGVDLGGHLEEHFLPSADHTFSRNAERMVLIETLIAWLQAGWPSGE